MILLFISGPSFPLPLLRVCRKSMLNDVVRYDVQEKSWGRALSMDAPHPRYHHTASLYNGSMFIFGTQNPRLFGCLTVVQRLIC